MLRICICVYLLKTEVMEAADKWDEGCKKRRGVKDGIRVFVLSHCENRVVIT